MTIKARARHLVTALLSAAAIAALGSTIIQAETNLLSNPGFEEQRSDLADGWAPYGSGYQGDSEVRRAGARSIRCKNGSAEEARGAGVTLNLNQREPAPLLVSGWSRAEGVGGTVNSEYSIYVDLELADGSPLWGQTAPFAVGTHDWQRRQVLISTPKPIRTARIYALFRHHSGIAWFDDFSAVQLSGSGVFDSQPLTAPELGSAPSGWFARDVSAGSSLVPLAAGKPNSLNLIFSSEARGKVVDAAVRSPGKPRAITLYFVERFAGGNPLWWNDIRQSVAAKTGERANLTRVGGVGATGSQSLYPFGCVTGGGKGRALGVPPLLGPRVCRVGYHAASRLLYVAFDVMVAPDRPAGVSIARYDVDPDWGFRSAAERYYRLFPEAFERRAKAEGIWIPFTDPGKVENAQDFGFAYHEGDNSVAGDDQSGILSFRYTEPMTWWMPMPPAVERTYNSALKMVREHAAGGSESNRRWAQAVLNSGSQNSQGKFNVEFQNAPWTNGAVWVLNPNPAIPHPPEEWTKARLSYTPESANTRYASAGGGLDGEYLDSIEGWADVLDFRPESLRASRAPATFTTEERLPVIPTWFSVYELADSMRADLRRRGKLLMANSTPWRIFTFAPLLDVMGTETNWLPGGTWRPDSDAVFNLRRTLCWQKPYLLLQNTDFDRFTPDRVEKYFQRSLFYGVYPSMFSVDASSHPYWQEPRWYNRDRHLFRKYIPIVRRLSAAGWQPITFARSGRPEVYVERFGNTYLTLLNDSPAALAATLTIDLQRLNPSLARSPAIRLTDEITGESWNSLSRAGKLKVAIPVGSEQSRCLRLEAAPNP